MNCDYSYNYKNYFKKYLLVSKKMKNKEKLNKIQAHTKVFMFLSIKPLQLIPFYKNKNRYHNTKKTLALNFKRNRFFPTLRTLKGENYLFLSLGMFMKFFQKNKSFLKTKTMYLLLTSFLRKVLLFSTFKNLVLTISKIPVFLKEILNTLNDPVTNFYKSPFSEATINEKVLINPFKFSLIMFLNNKSFGQMKLKKKGRLKRKISKRITLLNRMVD